MDARERTQTGFSLTELLIVLAIAGSLAFAGAPTLGNLLRRSAATTAEVSLASHLQHARNTAIARNARTLMCPSDDGRHCRPGDEWQHGWIIAEDANHDGQPDAGVALIAVHSALASGIRVISSARRTHVTFQPTGSAGGSNVRFTICHAREAKGWSVVVANSGRVRADTPDPARLRQCLAGLR